jgi:hypothetical protein
MKQLSSGNCTSIIIVLISLPIFPAKLIAQNNNFNNFNLALDFNQAAAIVMGYTGGSYSLASIANQDIHGNPCMGYGDPEPDHLMILENDFPQLKLQVNSGGQDTTLIIQDVNNEMIFCSFGQEDVKDALIKEINWKAGKYNIWVGSIKPNQRSSYTLSVEQ